jgi:pyruvate/2-oxoglutarate dehydrogenase complex dihydrolipoamide dehydrogenase (E3) component
VQGANEVEVQLNGGGSQSLKAKNVIIATGSEVSPEFLAELVRFGVR